MLHPVVVPEHAIQADYDPVRGIYLFPSAGRLDPRRLGANPYRALPLDIVPPVAVQPAAWRSAVRRSVARVLRGLARRGWA